MTYAARRRLRKDIRWGIISHRLTVTEDKILRWHPGNVSAAHADSAREHQLPSSGDSLSFRHGSRANKLYGGKSSFSPETCRKATGRPEAEMSRYIADWHIVPGQQSLRARYANRRRMFDQASTGRSVKNAGQMVAANPTGIGQHIDRSPLSYSSLKQIVNSAQLPTG